MFPVAVMAGAGWLFLFVVLLIVPPSPGPHEGVARARAGRRVVAHVALRAGARGEVPAPALSDGFGGGETVVEGRLRELARRIDFNQY